MSRRVVPFALVGITGLAAYLRFVALGVPSLWLDEILHLRIERSLDWSEGWRLLGGLREARGYRENGVLYYVFQALGQWIAPGDLGVRVAPAIVGTLTVPFFGLVAGRFATPKDRPLVVIGAAFAMAVAPLHVFYSREGRPYYLLLALAVVLLGLLTRAVRPEPISGRAFAETTVLCLVSVYVGLHALPLLASAAAIAALVLGTTLPFVPTGQDAEAQKVLRRNLLSLLAALGLALALCFVLYVLGSRHNVPTLELREDQRRIVAAPNFDAPLTVLTLQRFVASMATAGDPTLHVGERVYVLFSFAVLGLVALFAVARRGPPSEGPSPLHLGIVAAGMFFLPAAASFAALVLTGRWYHVRYTSVALPGFLLLVSVGVVTLGAVGASVARRVASRAPERVLQVAAWAVALGLAVFPNVGPALAEPHHKLDWRGIAEVIDEIVLPGEPILVSTDWPIVCLGHYLDQRGRDIEFVKIWERSDLGQEAVDQRERGWMLSAGFRQSNDARDWMFGYAPVLQTDREAFALFYFPDLADLLATDAKESRGTFFEDRFAAWEQRFDFDGSGGFLQGHGWSYPEREPEFDYRWAVGEEAVLGVPIGAPRDLEIETRLRPFRYRNAPDAEIEFWLGERLVDQRVLSRGWNQFRFAVPAEVWETEPHVLRIVFSVSGRPVDWKEGEVDDRNLAAAFDWLRVAEPGT